VSRFDLSISTLAPGTDVGQAAATLGPALGMTVAETEAALESLPFVLARNVEATEADRLSELARAAGLTAERRAAQLDTRRQWSGGELELDMPASMPTIPERARSTAPRSVPPVPRAPSSQRPPAAPASSPPARSEGPSGPPDAPASQAPRSPQPGRSRPPSAHRPGENALSSWSLDDAGPPLELDMPAPPSTPPRPAQPVEAPTAARVGSEHELPIRPSYRPASGAPPALGHAEIDDEFDPEGPFAEQIRDALRIPFSAGGVQWFLQFVGLSLAAGVLTVGTSLFGACVPGGVFLSLAGTIVYGGLIQALVVRWFRASLGAAHEGKSLPETSSALEADSFLTGLMIYAVVMALNGLALWAWARTRSFGADPAMLAMQARALVRILVPLNVVLALHQPIGLAFLVARERRSAYFSVFGPLRLFGAAPAHLLAVYGLYGVGLVALSVIVSLLSMSGSLLLALAALLLLSLGGFLLYGALGAMLGVLLRRHPEVV
jgi:hypothetical protein